MTQQLNPKDAASLFYAGHPMVYVSDPTSPFVCGQWQGQRSMITRLPFNDAEAYFTENPVALYSTETAAAPATPPTSVWVSSGADTQITVGEDRNLTLSFHDEFGATFDPPSGVVIAWEVADDAVLTLSSASENPTVATGQAAGVTRVTATASGGSLASPLSDTVDMTVVAPAR